MQQWYICPRCGRYVQYGQVQCSYCGYHMYWQAPTSSLMGKLKSIFAILAQKTPPVQYPIPVQPPSYPQAPEPIQSIQPAEPGQPTSSTQVPISMQPPTPVQTRALMPPPTTIQPPAPIQPPTPVQAPSSVQPPAPVQSASPIQPPATAPMDKLKSILGIPFQTPPSKHPQQQFTPQQEAVNNTTQDRRNLKDTLTAYLYWLCFGSHYNYFDNMRTQVIFWVTLGGAGIWWLIDMFRIPGMVNDYNINQLLNAVLKAEALNKQKSSKDNQSQ